MKLFYYSLAGFALLLFGYNLYQSLSTLSAGHLISINELSGFGDTGQADPEYDKLIDAYNQKIAAYRAQSEDYRKYVMWASLGVTALTALSTLLTTLKAVDNSVTIATRFVKTIAILAFVSTLASWGSSQLTDRKSQLEQFTQKCRDNKVAFYALYDKATDDAERRRLVHQYRDKLADN